MIHYTLNCSHDHAFDGWFRNSDSFDNQAGAGLVVCPECGDTAIRRAMMTPALGRRGNRQSVATAPAEPEIIPPAPQGAPKAAAVLPDQLRAVLQRMRAEVEAKCEHVGDRFAEEARAIHNGETDARPIYGEATPDQAESLADDGIEITRIPWIPRADG